VRIRLVSIAVCALALLVAGTAAAAPSTTIRWKNGRVTQIGALKTTGTPTIARATAAFGAPAKIRLDGKVLCIVDWTALGLRGNFVNLGGPVPGETTCSPDVGKLQSAEVRGAGLQTPAGLRVGATVARLQKLHPSARRHGSTWWLATAPNVFGGDGSGRFPIVRANVKAGKVSALVLWIGAAGE
jgi:hypothetical protein